MVVLFPRAKPRSTVPGGFRPQAAVLAWRLVVRHDRLWYRINVAGYLDRRGGRVSWTLADHCRASHAPGSSVQRGRAAGGGTFRSPAGTGGGDRLGGDWNLFRRRLRPARLDRAACGAGVPVVRARTRPRVPPDRAARIRGADDRRQHAAQPLRWLEYRHGAAC